MKNTEAMTAQVSSLVEELRSLRQELLRVKGRDVSEMKLARPAGEETICKTEERSGFSFPPSYRAFLKLHNGWYLFWPDWSLLGVSGTLTEKMLGDVRKTMESYEQRLLHEGYLEGDPEAYVAALKKEEKANPNVIYPPHHPVLGTDFNGGLLAFDRNRRGPNGENEVAALRYAEVQYRFKSFLELLSHAIESTQAELQKVRTELPEQSPKGDRRKGTRAQKKRNAL